MKFDFLFFSFPHLDMTTKIGREALQCAGPKCEKCGHTAAGLHTDAIPGLRWVHCIVCGNRVYRAFLEKPPKNFREDAGRFRTDHISQDPDVDRVCEDCGKRPPLTRSRFCPQCVNRRALETNRRSILRKQGVAIPDLRFAGAAEADRYRPITVDEGERLVGELVQELREYMADAVAG